MVVMSANQEKGQREGDAMPRTLVDDVIEAVTDHVAWPTYILAFIATYAAALPQANGGITTTDFAAHAALIPTWQRVAYPGWHFCGYIFYVFLSCDLAVAAALSSGFFAVLTAIVVRLMGRRLLPDASKEMLALCTFLLSFVGPLFFPSIKESYLVGTGSPNTWHNPTNNAVKPFALMCLLLYGELCTCNDADARHERSKNRSLGLWLGFAGLLLVSTLCKPSFLQVFLPAVAVYNLFYLLNRGTSGLAFVLKSFVSCLPSLLPFFIQYVTYFGGGDAGGGMAVEPFAVWSTFTPSILYSIACATAFPLFAIVVSHRILVREPIVDFALLSMTFGIAEYVLFAETGPSRLYGNFGWGWLISCSLIWCVGMFRFVGLLDARIKHGTVMRFLVEVGYALLASHFFLGFVYYLKVVSVGVLEGRMYL